MRLAIITGFVLLLLVGMAPRPQESSPTDKLEQAVAQAEQLKAVQAETLDRLWRFHLKEFGEEFGVVNVPRFVDALMGVQDDVRWILASVCVQESHGIPTRRGKAGERGGFQVIPRYWGPVPATLSEQALQAERILRQLLAEKSGNISQALERYNGSKAYATEVVARVERRHALLLLTIDDKENI